MGFNENLICIFANYFFRSSPVFSFSFIFLHKMWVKKYRLNNVHYSSHNYENDACSKNHKYFLYVC